VNFEETEDKTMLVMSELYSRTASAGQRARKSEAYSDEARKVSRKR
jgi:hypothetical protein